MQDDGDDDDEDEEDDDDAQAAPPAFEGKGKVRDTHCVGPWTRSRA